MNAYKNERCEWVEFPSGKKVPFHHFPEFDQGSGKTGDTLVWYPKSNHLAVESQGAEASVLCYRPKLDGKLNIGALTLCQAIVPENTFFAYYEILICSNNVFNSSIFYLFYF